VAHRTPEDLAPALARVSSLPDPSALTVQARQSTTKEVPVKRTRRCDRGASAVEYALIIMLIAIVIVGAVTFFGQKTNGLFQNSCTSFAAAAQDGGC
jgi:pilus assembly protein Flp/PilA